MYDFGGYLPIHQATSCLQPGCAAIIDAFLNRDVPLNVCTSQSRSEAGSSESTRRTLLHTAAFYGNKYAMVFLLNQISAKPKIAHMINAQEIKTSYTPLHTAVLKNHASLTNLLLNAGSDYRSRDGLHETPLMLAVLTGHIDCALEFLRRGWWLTAMDLALLLQNNPKNQNRIFQHIHAIFDAYHHTMMQKFEVKEVNPEASPLGAASISDFANSFSQGIGSPSSSSSSTLIVLDEAYNPEEKNFNPN